MGRQPRLVLLLLLAIGAVQVALASTPRPALNLARAASEELLSDNLLDDGSEEPQEQIHTGIKISTPKVKEVPPPLVTTSATSSDDKASKSSTGFTTHKPISDEILKDLIEASKHSDVLADDLRLTNILPQLNATAAGNSNSNSNNNNIINKSDESYDDDDDYNYDYDDDYNYDEATSPEPAKKSTKATSGSSSTSTSTTTKKPAKKDPSGMIKLRPIKGDDKALPKSEKPDEDKSKPYSLAEEDDYADDDEDDDEDDAAEDEDDDEDDDIADEEEIVFNENVPCPRDCICERNINSYMVATCSRLDPGKQKFGSDITDLVVTDVGPKYPILLGPEFFVKIGLKYVSSIKIANCTIEYLHQSAFHGLDELYSVNLTNVGLAIINPDTFVNNTKLRLLTISGNDLSIMSSVHYMLKSDSLEELDLSRNNLMELAPNAFSHLSNVVYINLQQNNLQQIPEKIFSNLITIEELDLSYNSLKTLPAGIFNGTEIAILRLKNNEITGDLRFGTWSLQQLDLSYNSIKQIHHGMFDKMTELTNLILKGNGITKIQPDSFLTLKNLRHIDLSINELDQVSSLLFYKNSELDVIRLNDNPRLSQLPTDGFQSDNGFFNVYYLDVSNCAIGALGHNTFATMPRLATLKLAWNNINNLEADTFASLPELADLDLSNNLIVQMDDLMFMKNNYLTKLNLAGNPIRKLSVRLFLPLNKLAELDVSECELHSLLAETQYGVGRKYKFYETLRSFNASGNHIKRISAADVKGFKNLRTLDVSHNPLKCNVDFQDFISYVSVSTTMLPSKVPVLANLESTNDFTEFQPHAGWAELAREVCKHHDDNGVEADEKELEKELDEDAKNLRNIVESNRLKQTILKDSRKSDVLIERGDENDSETDADADDFNDEDDLNHAAEDKDDDGAADDDDDDEEENESDYDEDEDDEDEEEEDGADDDQANDEYDGGFGSAPKKTKKVKSKVDVPKVGDNGLSVDSVDLEKETRDKFLLNKFILNGDESENYDDEDTRETIIEHRRAYIYTDYQFLIPLAIIISCAIVVLLAIAKVVSLVMRKRGERYRMALLASSNNSIVYQKLSEEIKPTVHKEPKQPKVHRYSPINQV